MKKLVWVILTLLLLTACGQQTAHTPAVTPTPTPTITPAPTPTPMVLEVSVGREGYTLDPTYISDVEDADYILHLFEGLTKYVPDGEGAVTPMALTLGMAADWKKSEDGLTYTFRIREDAVWSDGVPVRAQDFVYAWRRLFTPSAEDEMKHSATAVQLFGVLKNAAEVSEGKVDPEQLGVRAVSDKVLEVTLARECSHFLKLCASACLLPLRQDIIEAHGGDWTAEGNLVVNGAFTLERLVHDDRMILKANPLYYDAAAIGPDTIVWHFAHGSGEGLDFVGDAPDPTAAGWGASPRAGTYYLYLNVNNIKNWRVRAAMTLAIDRDAIASAVGGGAAPAVGMIPPGIADSSGREYVPAADAAAQPLYAWLSETYPDYDLNDYGDRCRLARRLFEEAVGSGAWYRSYKVYYRFNESTVNRIVAETCQKNWRDVLGLTAEFSCVDGETYAAGLRNGTFGVAYLGWLPDYNDPQSFLDIMRRGGAYNYAAWGDGNYTEYVDSILTEYDPVARDEMQLTADSLLFTEWRFAVCPVFCCGDTWQIADGVSGVGHSGIGRYSFHYTVK